MNSRLSRFLVPLLAIIFVQPLDAQYERERVMEKSFEHADFFFAPYRFLPYGIGDFRRSVSGMLDDPFLDLDVNPARLYRDSAGADFLTIDFRNAREVTDYQGVYFPYPMYRTAAMDIAYSPYPYPRFYWNSRRELEPSISLAYLTRPRTGFLSSFSFGGTYQLITQDEDYYPIPQDIYRSVVGLDYAGDRMAGAENIPIVDKYSGADEMHQEGHFASLFAGVDLSSDLQLGAKLGRVVFEREGSHGTTNVWDNSTSYESTWQNMEFREQTYGHWEVTAGVRYALDNATTFGISAGLLDGSVDQSLPRSDSSYNRWGPVGSTTENWSEYSSSGAQTQSWKRDGTTRTLGADLSSHINADRRVQLMYSYSREDIDIALSGDIGDHSLGRSRYQWDTTLYQHQSRYEVIDVRAGTGTSVTDLHRLAATYQWQLSENTTLSFGAQYELREHETKTIEQVTASRYSRYSTTGSYPYSSFDSTAEWKSLHWNFQTRLTRLTIPIFLTVRASQWTEFMFGLNRTASNWKAEDVTLALFEKRVEADQNGQTTKQNFGERYTEPRVRESEVRTTFLAGLIVTPKPSLQVRFLAVPNYVDTYHGAELSDVQLWISVSVKP